MIYYLTSKRLASPMLRLLTRAGKAFSERIRIVYYETLFEHEALRPPAGAYIFTATDRDLGSFDPPSPQRKAMASFHDFLVKQNGAHKVLNHPQRSLERYDLLRTLYARGINRFNVWRATDPQGPERYPVLVRHEHGSQWTPIPLAQNRAELEAIVSADKSPETLLAVEYCDTQDAAGVYRKYGAFIVGEHIVPRHVHFQRQWQVKQAKLLEPAQIEEELHYVETNPHAGVLLEVCRIAGISYGRVDYALLDGRPQIWEINITPGFGSNPAKQLPERAPAKGKFFRLFSDALEALDR